MDSNEIFLYQEDGFELNEVRKMNILVNGPEGKKKITHLHCHLLVNFLSASKDFDLNAFFWFYIYFVGMDRCDL